MSYNREIIDFVLKGFIRTGKAFEMNGIHQHVLKNKNDNFFWSIPDFKLHRWAGSLKSSQALAYNIFSGVKGVIFEFDMWALDNTPNHKACIDVVFENTYDIVQMFEVKMFEFSNSGGKNKIFNKPDQQKYMLSENYKWNQEVVPAFIDFIKKVKDHFKDRPIYGEGIKQLCCHILGIINEMTIKDGKLNGKKVQLYSLCFDNPFTPKFERDIQNYISVLNQFNVLVNTFLREIGFDQHIVYKGFLPLSSYIGENSDFLGLENCRYVANRYYENLL